MENLIDIRAGEMTLAQAEAVILVPKDAPELSEKMIVMVAGSKANSKHTVHALSEIALIDFEDKVLTLEPVADGKPFVVTRGQWSETVDEGLLVARDEHGKTRLFAHDATDVYRLLKFAHRYCTRWVRLDI